jgi:hypothetical protein
MASLPPAAVNGAGELAQLHAEFARLAAAARKDQRDSLRILAVLIRKLGGTARITRDDLLAAADGTLTRMDCDDGFVLTVTGNSREN